MTRTLESERNGQLDGYDRVILERLRQHDVAALEMLIDLYTVRIRQIALSIVQRSDLADDVVQETFVSLWERRMLLPITDSLLGYLCRTARNIALKVVRHEKVEQRVHDTLEQGYRIAKRTTTNEGATTLDAEELSTVIHRVLGTLQPQVREVFLMRRLQGLSYEHIASILEISVLSARSQMSRAIRQLADALKRME